MANTPLAPDLNARRSAELANDAWLAELAGQLRPLLELTYVRRTRRNHALEHATIHLLTARLPETSMAGRSDDHGFILIGEVSTDAVEQAVNGALARLQGGQRDFALHPYCGTNLVATAMLASAAALVSLAFVRPHKVLNRLPMLMIGMMAASLFGQPLGMSLQRHITTEADPGDLEIVSVVRRSWRLPLNPDTPVTVHRITTRGG
jgi:hypothetical protein